MVLIQNLYHVRHVVIFIRIGPSLCEYNDMANITLPEIRISVLMTCRIDLEHLITYDAKIRKSHLVTTEGRTYLALLLLTVITLM